MGACEDLITDPDLSDDLKQDIIKAIARGDSIHIDNIVKKIKSYSEREFLKKSDHALKKGEIFAKQDTRVEKYGKGNTEYVIAGEDYIGAAGVRQRTGGTSLDMDIRSQMQLLVHYLGDGLKKLRPGLLLKKRSVQFGKEVWTRLYDSTAKVSKEAEKMAENIRRMTDYVHKRYNDLSVPLSHLGNYGIPIRHNAIAIAKLDEDAWLALVKETMDLSRIDPSPGKTVDDVLRSMRKNIINQDSIPFDDRLLSAEARPIYGRSFQKERMLQPMSGEGYLKYISAAGVDQDPYSAVMKYMDMISRDLASIQKLGPTPNQMVDDMARNMVAKTGNAQAATKFKEMYDHLRYRNLAGDPTQTAMLLNDLKALMTITKLTMTPITALTDVAFTQVTKAFGGYKPFIRLSRRLSRLKPGSLSDRQIAAKLSLLFEDAMRNMNLTNRFGDLSGHAFMSRLADESTHLSGLAWWTNGQKRAGGLDFLSTLGETDVLKGNLKLSLERYGITPDDFTAMTKARTEINGIKFLDVNKLTDENLKLRVLSMVNSEVGMMVPEANVKATTLLAAGLKPGTVRHAIITNMGQFKSFGASVAYTHLVRATDAMRMGGNQAAYGPTLLAMGMGMGALQGQIKDIAKGHDPRKLDDPKLWMDALLSSGLMTPIGSMLLNDPTLFGGIAKAVVGPGIGTIIDAFTVLAAPWHKGEAAREGLWDYYVAAGYKGLTKNGFFNQLWYTRAAWNHSVGKFAGEKLNENFQESESWMDNKLFEEGRGDYWGTQRAGGLLPERMPASPWSE